MKKNIQSIITLLALVIFQVQIATAQAQGTAFTYQGRLNDGNGPASGSYDVKFGIFNQLANGVQQGEWLTNSAVVITNGLFTVTLDFGNQFPGGGEFRWLEVGVRTNSGGVAFTTLTPRQPITPTPYAIYSANASNSLTAGSVTGGQAALIATALQSVPPSYALKSDATNAAASVMTANLPGYQTAANIAQFIAASNILVIFTNAGASYSSGRTNFVNTNRVPTTVITNSANIPPVVLTNNNLNIRFIGDSITDGVFTGDGIGYRRLVTNYLDTASRSVGQSGVMAIKSYDSGYPAYYYSTNLNSFELTNDIVVIQASINDLRFALTNSAVTPDYALISAQGTLINKCKTGGTKMIVLVTVPDWCTREGYTNYGVSTWPPNLVYSNNNGFTYSKFRQFTRTVKEWQLNQATNNVIVCDLSAIPIYKNIADGVHPNQGGHILMGDLIINAIRNGTSPAMPLPPKEQITITTANTTGSIVFNDSGYSELIFNRSTNVIGFAGITLPGNSSYGFATLGQILRYTTSGPVLTCTVYAGDISATPLTSIAAGQTVTWICVTASRFGVPGDLGAEWIRIQ